MPAKVISFINLKGGVGKSTLAMIVAEYLAFRHKKRVLAIDLDSQSNLTTAMVDKDSINKLQNAGRTIYDLFKTALYGKSTLLSQFLAAPPLVVSNVARWTIQGTTAGLDMIISTPALAQLDEEMLVLWENGSPAPQQLRYILRSALEPLSQKYDAVIIDCPPGLSLFTSNAIMASDYFVSPAIPEPLSVKGIDLVQERISELRKADPKLRIEFAGTILNKVMHYRKTHMLEASYLYGAQVGAVPAIPKQRYKVFDWWVPDAEFLRKIGEFEDEVLERGKYNGLVEKYDPSYKLTNPVGKSLLDRSNAEGQNYRLWERLDRLAQELMGRIGISP